MRFEIDSANHRSDACSTTTGGLEPISHISLPETQSITTDDCTWKRDTCFRSIVWRRLALSLLLLVGKFSHKNRQDACSTKKKVNFVVVILPALDRMAGDRVTREPKNLSKYRLMNDRSQA
ncbi:MAG: hypothetical protein JGK31_33135 [Microcoleus sp. PH2017_30_WIL_O_A]|uniref:hypothetical protein n=1 Tax=Microcoleus sp. PH2017_36_ELK_O_B TaxID=2798846 RepID=UPI001DB92A26|nr:hypothetical protein [Microcoleus sp. PH2017_36_ELK_O_B]MCC3511102.1 hypothetical protein [Microcoleus sp. PH2017_17_BER_D_A]MCC3588794.1 hypothetical protein [Microcoleus sp. PH2017_30_WIL_O_A]MCC3623864.1 hypothetical protein [Microcoleus sp. PH2017_36_ELK_O_B]